MLKILCTGDSHTWGQGASGVKEQFDTPWVAGELRPVDFDTGSYVNVLRRMVEAATGSRSYQWKARDLAALSGGQYEAPCALLEQDARLTFQGELLRIIWAPQQENVRWIVSIDGQESALTLSAAESGNDYRISTYHLKEGPHTLSLKQESGTLRIFRLESYSGSAAVINSGIGSCPTFRFRDIYWENYVTAVKPDIVLAEAHTINDWLSGDSPETYRKNLTQLLTDFRLLGAATVLMTVAPIGGSQKLPQTADHYDAFVAASRLAARDAGAILCDANAVMKLMLDGLTQEQASAYLLDDNWHPNDRGHAVYATLLSQSLGQIMNIPVF